MSADDREALLAEIRAQIAAGKPVTAHRMGGLVDPEKTAWDLLLGRPVATIKTTDDVL